MHFVILMYYSMMDLCFMFLKTLYSTFWRTLQVKTSYKLAFELELRLLKDSYSLFDKLTNNCKINIKIKILVFIWINVSLSILFDINQYILSTMIYNFSSRTINLYLKALIFIFKILDSFWLTY